MINDYERTLISDASTLDISDIFETMENNYHLSLKTGYCGDFSKKPEYHCAVGEFDINVSDLLDSVYSFVALEKHITAYHSARRIILNYWSKKGVNIEEELLNGDIEEAIRQKEEGESNA